MATTQIVDYTNQPAHPSGSPDLGGVIGPYAYSGLPYVVASSGTIHCLTRPPGHVRPQDYPEATPGTLLEWNYDPAVAGSGGSGTTLTNSYLFLQAIYVRVPLLITNVWVQLQTAALTPTASESAVGLYNSAGTLLSGSADAGTVLSGSTGGVYQPLTTPQNVGQGMYWVALLSNASTAPKLAATQNTAALANVGLPAASMRFCVNGTSATSLPSSLTLSSNTATGAATFWVGVS